MRSRGVVLDGSYCVQLARALCRAVFRRSAMGATFALLWGDNVQTPQTYSHHRQRIVLQSPLFVGKPWKPCTARAAGTLYLLLYDQPILFSGHLASGAQSAIFSARIIITSIQSISRLFLDVQATCGSFSRLCCRFPQGCPRIRRA